MRTLTRCPIRLSAGSLRPGTAVASRLFWTQPGVIQSSVVSSTLSSFRLLGISAKFVQQLPRRCRNSNFAIKNFMAVHTVAVHGFVATFVGLHHGSVEAHSNESAFGARIRQNLCVQLKVGASRGVPAHGPGCHRSVGS